MFIKLLFIKCNKGKSLYFYSYNFIKNHADKWWVLFYSLKKVTFDFDKKFLCEKYFDVNKKNIIILTILKCLIWMAVSQQKMQFVI